MKFVKIVKMVCIATILLSLTACGKGNTDIDAAKVSYFNYNSIVHYYDEPSNSVQPLCFEASCSHISSNCNAYIGGVEFGKKSKYFAGKLYKHNDKLYAVEREYDANKRAVDWLVEADIRGNNRQKIVEVASQGATLGVLGMGWGMSFIGDYFYYIEAVPKDSLNREEDKNIPEEDYGFVEGSKHYVRFCRVKLEQGSQVEVLSDYIPAYASPLAQKCAAQIAGNDERIYYLISNVEVHREGYIQRGARVWCYDVVSGELQQLDGIILDEEKEYQVKLWNGHVTNDGKVYFDATDKAGSEYYIMKYDTATGKIEKIYSTALGTCTRTEQYTDDYIYLTEFSNKKGEIKIIDYSGNVIDAIEYEYNGNSLLGYMNIKKSTEDYVIIGLYQSMGVVKIASGDETVELEAGDPTKLNFKESVLIRVDKKDFGTGNIRINKITVSE